MSSSKKKIDDIKVLNENLIGENTNLKHQLEEIKLSYDKTVASMQNDMKIIKNEWDKKCQEIDLNSQRQMVIITKFKLNLKSIH